MKFGNVQRAVKHKVNSEKISRRWKLGKCPDSEWLGTALRDPLKSQVLKIISMLSLGTLFRQILNSLDTNISKLTFRKTTNQDFYLDW